MINLAGVKEADEFIQEELYLAGIKLVHGEQSKGEVPYTIIGKLGGWNFERAWTYWMASAQEGKGIPLELATELHERKYPIVGENQPETLGKVIRVDGDCTSPHPKEHATQFSDLGFKIIIDPDGSKERESEKYFKQHPEYLKNPEYKFLTNNVFVPNLDGVVTSSFINSYHIDNQIGLNALAKVIEQVTEKRKYT